MRKIPYVLFVMLCIGALLAGCNLPFLVEDNASVQTAAALTVQAQLTAVAPATATFTSVPFPTVPPANTLPPPATSTRAPAATPTTSCDMAQFINDVSVPDGTTMDPGETFTKTWRLKNIGSCTWSGYNLVFDSGDLMGGTSPTAIGSVAPGQEVDLSVNLTAPSSDGSYRGYWRIRNPSGVLLPVVSGYQAKSFYVDIKVGTATGAFAVTHVTYAISSWSDSGHTNCPRVKATITVNKPGTVTFKWTRKDTPGGGSIQTLDFAAAGSQTASYDWARGSALAGTDTWVGVYIDTPNHQDFGHLDFDTACTSP